MLIGLISTSNNLNKNDIKHFEDKIIQVQLSVEDENSESCAIAIRLKETSVLMSITKNNNDFNSRKFLQSIEDSSDLIEVKFLSIDKFAVLLFRCGHVMLFD